ncbi:hypothetical protein EJ08DRAFT_697968 [Tothia fuscella]|uniref:Uncharacterized protein n=1 Tax=Tothia fuscella TaxID=1048955 RepID=A0A9P4TXX2_9PEZI|nr:hypothetical protein EJ08DRAFT_697968 [Tothia fuscella]
MGLTWTTREVKVKFPKWNDKERASRNSTSVVDFERGVQAAPAPLTIHTVDTEETGWKSWFSRDIMGYFILGMLVPLPQMTIMSAARLMFPGITGIFGIALAVPAATAAYSLPFFAYHIPYNIVVVINIVVAILSLVTCTLGTSIAGPVVGTVLAGLGAAIGQYLYLAVAAFYPQRSVITFSIGTRVIFVVRAAMYMGFMAAFHDDWRLSIRIIAPLPLLHGLVYWLMLTPKGRKFAEETRRRSSNGLSGAEVESVPTHLVNGRQEEGVGKLPHVSGLRGSIVFEEPQSPAPSLFSYPGSFQIPAPKLPDRFLVLHPDVEEENLNSSFDEVLEKFGCPAPDVQGTVNGDSVTVMRPQTPMFGRLLSVRSNTYNPRSHTGPISRDVSTRSNAPKPLSSHRPYETINEASIERPLPPLPPSSDGFCNGRSKAYLLWRTVIPHYAVPLMISVAGSMIAMTGFAPTYLHLNLFKVAPKGDLNYQLNTFSSGLAAVAFASYTLYKPYPWLWTISLCQSAIILLGLIQLFKPFFTYFPVWLVFAFLTGGLEGASVTNTNFAIARDFAKERGEVRSFAMSFGALGNFCGDVVGGAVAIGVQVAGERFLKVKT